MSRLDDEIERQRHAESVARDSEEAKRRHLADQTEAAAQTRVKLIEDAKELAVEVVDRLRRATVPAKPLYKVSFEARPVGSKMDHDHKGIRFDTTFYDKREVSREQIGEGWVIEDHFILASSLMRAVPKEVNQGLRLVRNGLFKKEVGFYFTSYDFEPIVFSEYLPTFYATSLRRMGIA